MGYVRLRQCGVVFMEPSMHISVEAAGQVYN